MPWGLAAVAAIGYLGSESASKRASRGANSAADRGAFKPYNVYSGYGSGTFKGNKATASLSPEYQQIRDSYLDMAGQQRGAISGYRPQEAAQNMYGKLSALSRQDEDESRLGLENRLLAQGMLGSTGGAQRMNAFEDSANDARLKREVASYGMAQDDLDSMIRREMGLTQGASQIDALPLQQLNQGGVFGGSQAQGNQFGANLQNNAAINRSDSNAAFWSSLGSAVGPAISQGYQDYQQRQQPQSQYNNQAQYSAGAFGGGDYFDNINRR